MKFKVTTFKRSRWRKNRQAGGGAIYYKKKTMSNNLTQTQVILLNNVLLTKEHQDTIVSALVHVMAQRMQKEMIQTGFVNERSQSAWIKITDLLMTLKVNANVQIGVEAIAILMNKFRETTRIRIKRKDKARTGQWEIQIETMYLGHYTEIATQMLIKRKTERMEDMPIVVEANWSEMMKAYPWKGEESVIISRYYKDKAVAWTKDKEEMKLSEKNIQAMLECKQYFGDVWYKELTTQLGNRVNQRKSNKSSNELRQATRILEIVGKTRDYPRWLKELRQEWHKELECKEIMEEVLEMLKKDKQNKENEERETKKKYQPIWQREGMQEKEIQQLSEVYMESKMRNMGETPSISTGCGRRMMDLINNSMDMPGMKEAEEVMYHPKQGVTLAEFAYLLKIKTGTDDDFEKRVRINLLKLSDEFWQSNRDWLREINKE